jgi:hypothetical protein
MERENSKNLIKPFVLAAVLVMGAGLAACSSGSSGDGTTSPISPTSPITVGTGALEGQPRDGYVGSATCRSCHQGEYHGWAETVHGDMIQVANEETMAPWARQELERYLASDPGSQFLGIGSEGNRGQLQSIEDIKYVVGGKWKQRYIVKSDEGHVFLRYQYYWSKADGSHDHWSEGPDRDDRWHDYGGNRVYEDRCLDCHSTGFDLARANTLDRTDPNYTLGSVVSELGIGCEKCHGPGEAHVLSLSRADISNPKNFTPDQQVQFCGTCHGRNAGHAEIDGREDALGFALGDANLHEVVRMLDVTDPVDGNVAHNPGTGYFAGTSQRFHADGASRSHRQQYNDFIQGPHYGKVTCTDCHNVHAGNTLKTATTTALCATCHDGSIAPGRMFTRQDIDAIMPKRAQSSNRPDISTHTFLYGGSGKPSPEVVRNEAGEVAPARAQTLMAEATYMGSAWCLQCHNEQHAGWAATVHGDMARAVNHLSDDTRLQTIKPQALELLQQALATPDALVPDYSGFTDQPNYEDLLYYEHGATGLSGHINSIEDIKYVVGGKWKQRYVVFVPDAGHVFLRWQFYDSPDGTNPRAHSYTEARAYEDRCLACHSTGFDPASVPALTVRSAEYHLEGLVAELGVGCESCHGPGSNHLSDTTSLAGIQSNIINPARFTSGEQFDACGSCHARNDGTNGFPGRNDAPGFLIGDDLDDHVTVTRFENTPGRFHPDGAGSAHRMQYNDMEQGPKAWMSCSTCHDVHQGDNALKLVGGMSAGNSTAEKFDALCASCHGPGHGYTLDKTMPLRARSSNVDDIRTHTFILDANGNAVGNQP